MSELIARIPLITRGGEGDPEISDVTFDSRLVGPGALYVSIPGFTMHGDRFIAEAMHKGAAAIMSENPQPDCPAPWMQVDNPRKTLGIAARCVFGEVPSETTFVGITGTNGKTTTAYLFQNLLGKLFGQSSVWMYGTIKYSAGQTNGPASRTTPESADIFRAIGFAAAKPKAVVMEVSSHALALDRVAGLCFDIAVWTNLTQAPP